MFTAACGGPVATVCESHISLFEGIPTLALFTLLKMCGVFFTRVQRDLIVQCLALRLVLPVSWVDQSFTLYGIDTD